MSPASIRRRITLRGIVQRVGFRPERYADSNAAMDYLNAFGSKFAERFLACVEPAGFYVYGAPSDDVRAVLDGFGPVYLGWFGGFAR